jgi:hypothetical protein
LVFPEVEMAWRDGLVGDLRNCREFRLSGEICLLFGPGCIVGDSFDGLLDAESHAAGILDGDLKSVEDQRGPLIVDGVAHEGIDDFHQGVLDGFFVFDQGDGMKAALLGTTHATMCVLVEVAELLAFESGGAAADSADLDMSASSVRVRHGIYLFANFLIVRPQNLGFMGVRGISQDDICV